MRRMRAWCSRQRSSASTARTVASRSWSSSASTGVDVDLARAEVGACVEDAGFDAAYVTDHPAPTDPWLASGGHQTLDPFVGLSFIAAATQRILLQVHVLIAAYRNPFLSAKSIASLDVLSGGRVIAGVAAGYLEGEFEALGIDFASRNELTDERTNEPTNERTNEPTN